MTDTFTASERELAQWLYQVQHKNEMLEVYHFEAALAAEKILPSTWKILSDNQKESWLLTARELQKKQVFGIDVEGMAKEFHRVYEEQAIFTGWKTQKLCHANWEGLPPENRATMLRTCAIVVDWINKNKESHFLKGGEDK